MLVYSGSEILEVRPQEIISSKVELNNIYLKVVTGIKKSKKTKIILKPKHKKDIDNGEDR
tara:strand:+ start:184 stop:363 length:180 start_codon:yes stop_codon:yes gene_type:complete